MISAIVKRQIEGTQAPLPTLQRNPSSLNELDAPNLAKRMM
jgi:hypothetical protein